MSDDGGIKDDSIENFENTTVFVLKTKKDVGNHQRLFNARDLRLVMLIKTLLPTAHLLLLSNHQKSSVYQQHHLASILEFG